MMACKKCCDEGRDEEDKNGWGEAANATLLQDQPADDTATGDGQVPGGDQHGLSNIGSIACGVRKSGLKQRGSSAKSEALDCDCTVDNRWVLTP